MKHLLWVAFGIFFCAAVWVIARAGLDTSRSISLHASKTRISRIGFGSLVCVATVILGYQVFGWLLPAYQAGVVSCVLFGLMLGCFLVAAFVPHIEGTWREPIHNAVAWGMVYLIPLLMAFILRWPLSSVAWWSVVGMLLLNSILLLLSLVYYKQLRPWFLYFQLSYLAVFFSSLLVVTYW